ncbi:MAG: CDP-glycerol glycerophosphotransferase family protein [Clostridium sp.]|nr:CDP-glycerol glycerophosphotransferase family protein [Clostridium sp.]
MYRQVYDDETQQIKIEKDGYRGKVFIGLAEGNALRKIGSHFRTSLRTMIQSMDEFMGTVLRFILFSGVEINRKRIVFATFQNTYTCNCKYIAQELLKRKLDYEIIFIVDKICFDNKDLSAVPEGVKLVKRDSFESFFALATAHFWVDNALNCIWKAMPKKRGQIYLNTWHGSLGIKKLDGDAKWKKIAGKGNKLIDFFITNSEFEEDVFKNSFFPDVNCLRYGHPRNDMFFDAERMLEMKWKVYAHYGIDENAKTVLYAPTFRDDKNDINAIKINCKTLLNSLKSVSGGGKMDCFGALSFS